MADSNKNIRPILIENEMRDSYLDYAMSVIVSRALPDVRDGLKPVHRRILYAMKESGFDFNKPYRKSARVIGEVMGKYHPHGNTAIYDAMVRLAQPFSMRLPLIDGHGNFGSMDGDPAAAERYTEARLTRAAHAMLEDIEKDTVNFQPNYDNLTVEPTVLPARFPNLLVNGVGGIAVGMATNIPPHNLGEVLDACCAFLDNPNVTIAELMQIVHGPDFPTGAEIVGRAGIKSAYETGRGSIMMRAKSHVEELRKGKEAIIVTEMPYQVNKAKLVERIAELVNHKEIEGISDLRDESNRHGVRVVIELKKDASPDVVLNLLHRHTALQTSFGANIVALDKGRPLTMNLRDILNAFIQFREEVILRRTRFELAKAREKAHIGVGLAISVANIDDMILLIRGASNPEVAREQMMSREWPVSNVGSLLELAEPQTDLSAGIYKLSEAQARAILDLRLHRLTGLERDKIGNDLEELVMRIKALLEILGSKQLLFDIMRNEFLEIKERFATPRRSEIVEGEYTSDIEDLIQREDMVVTVSHNGYIKRVPLIAYRSQKRGGRGRSAMATRDEDFVHDVFVSNTHTPMIFFSSRGIAYTLKVYKLPLATPQSRGKAMINLLPLEQGETISTIMALPEDEATWANLHIVFTTSKGNIRRNALSDFLNIKSNGKIAMKLYDDEKLIDVKTCSQESTVLLATKKGKCIRFAISDLRVFSGRNSTGVRGVKLTADDEVMSMTVLEEPEFTIDERDAYLRQSSKLRRNEPLTPEESDLLSSQRFEEMAQFEEMILGISSNGYGKRTSSYEYRISGRGGLGMANMDLNDKNGTMVASFPVEDTDDIMVVTDAGQMIRCKVKDLRIAGRRTQGVRVIRVKDGEQVVSVARIPESEVEADESEDVVIDTEPTEA